MTLSDEVVVRALAAMHLEAPCKGIGKTFGQ